MQIVKLNKEKFSIIIPAYNEEKIIKETLEYLKNLSYPENKYEIIVIENCSIDKTYIIAKKFESNNFKIFHSEKKGVSKARNLGIEKLSLQSKWVLFLDADTFLKPNFLNELNDYLHKFPKYTHGTAYINPTKNTLKNRFFHFWLINLGDFLFKYLHRIHIVKKDYLSDIRYNEEMDVAEDLLFSKDLKKAGGKYFFMLTKNVLNSTRRWDNKGYLKPYLLNFYHSFLSIFNKEKLKKQKWKIIR